MSEGEFSVRQTFRDGNSETVRSKVDAATAVYAAEALVDSIGGRIGTTSRVVIIAGDDTIAFDWTFAEGVVFPPDPRGAAYAGPR